MKFLNLLTSISLTKTNIGTLALFLASTQISFGQTTAEKQRIANSYNQEALKKLEVEYATQAAKELEAAKRWAIDNNIPTQVERKSGSVDQLQKIIDGSPIYYTVGNVGASKTTRANTLNTGGTLGLNVNGENMTVGIWDGGSIRTTHQAFGTRATVLNGAFSTCNGNTGHATHVAGTMVAGSTAGNAKGMAPSAAVVSYDWNSDLSEVSAQAASGLLLSNHSYGYAVVDDNGVLQVQKHIIGKYTQDAASWDNLMSQAPYYQMVNAAGNDRQYQANITNKGGYDLLAGHSVSKNAIVVAAASEVANYTSASSVVMSSFSNWGPTDDGRIKPDITAKGVNVYSTYCTSNTSYSTLSGTSMASPNVTGTLLLLQQHYKNVNGGFMYASMLRGLAIHTADEAGTTTGPDYKFGWGLLNAKAGAELITKNGTNAILNSQVLANGQSYTITVTAASSGPLAATICWTDPAGTAITNTTIDPTTRALVNDLDIRITQNGTTFYPWKLNVASPTAAATQADNNVDNVEKIYIASPTPGAVYTITVTHKGTLASSQRFAFIVSGITTTPTGGGGTGTVTYCASKGNSTADEWIGNVQMGTFSNPSTQAQSTAGYTNYTASAITTTTGAKTLTLTPGFSSTAYSEFWRVWIDFNNDGDFVDAGEQVYAATAGATTAVSAAITIPTTSAGTIRRMRISMKYNVAQTGPCEAFDYGEVEDYTLNITAASSPAPTGYCASNGSNNTDEWIDLVEFGGISNVTAKNTGGYGNYTNLTGNLNIGGASQSVYVSAGFLSTAYMEYWRIWIDLNRDGDFTDAGELVGSANSSLSTKLTMSVTIPSTASAGLTRMRVSMKYNAAQTGPCEVFSYGEVEDYLVNLGGTTTLATMSNGGNDSESTLIFDEAITPTPDMLVYPNPALVQISLNMDRREGDVEYSIMNMHGAIVKTGMLYDRENTVVIEELPAGTYLVVAKNSLRTWTTKFLKVRD